MPLLHSSHALKLSNSKMPMLLQVMTVAVMAAVEETMLKSILPSTSTSPKPLELLLMRMQILMVPNLKLPQLLLVPMVMLELLVELPLVMLELLVDLLVVPLEKAPLLPLLP